jgi:hypothetical protein
MKPRFAATTLAVMMFSSPAWPGESGPVRLEGLTVYRASEPGFLEVGIELRNDFDRRVCGRVVVELLATGGDEVLASRTLAFQNLVSGERRQLEGRLAVELPEAGVSHRLRARLRGATPMLPGTTAPAAHAHEVEREFVPEELAERSTEP